MTKIATGKFYRIREGRVIGPAKRNATGVNELSHPWQVGGLTYADDGTYYAPFGTDLDIVEEVVPVTMTFEDTRLRVAGDGGVTVLDDD